MSRLQLPGGFLDFLTCMVVTVPTVSVAYKTACDTLNPLLLRSSISLPPAAINCMPILLQ